MAGSCAKPDAAWLGSNDERTLLRDAMMSSGIGKTASIYGFLGMAVLLVPCLLSGCTSLQTLSTGVDHEAEGAVLQIDSQVLVRYWYESVPYKPYVRELYSPAGVNVVRDNVPDHLHHHALMYAVAVDGVNFWEEQQQPGVQKNLGVGDVVVVGDTKVAGLKQKLDWINPRTNEVLLKEQRKIWVRLIKSDGTTLLTWEAKLSVPAGKDSATLSGSHYFGLGMRFVQSMDAIGKFSNADGKEGKIYRGEERLVDSDWCAYSAAVDGKPVTVAMFGHRSNPRYPTTWFTMAKPFAYMSATLNLHAEPLKIPVGEPLDLRYAVAVWDGHVDSDAIESLYEKWGALSD